MPSLVLPTPATSPSTCRRRIPDLQGGYTIPYLQSDRQLTVLVPFADSATGRARATLTGANGFMDGRLATAEQPTVHFADLATGTYALRLDYLGAAGAVAASVTWTDIGVGAILAALGDSLTEGYHGHGFWRDSLELSAADFPAAAVSRDGRNFPQFAPTSARHKPTVNCFQSWLPRLNDGLSQAWRQPVFIANEGWGGYTSGHYLEMMRTNQDGWRDRLRLLQPNVWLIHLGVNDERQQVAPDTFAANLEAIVDLLVDEFAAAPEAIYLARPSYDYHPGAEALLRQYIDRLDALVHDRGLRAGPDFFAAFATDRQRWYGSDPVHPGPDGMDQMADLWLAALAPNPPETARQPPTRRREGAALYESVARINTSDSRRQP